MICLLLPMVLILSVASICYANAYPPSSIFIAVQNAPKDLVLKIDPFTTYREDKVFETHFAFISGGGGPKPQHLTLQVTTQNSSYQIILPQITEYMGSFTLDLQNKTLAAGVPWLPAYEFASTTVLLTLLIEGIIFYLFGFRRKISWLIFLVTNLITQGVLYFILIIPLYTPFHNRQEWHLYFGEFCVFLIEIAAFTILIKERPRIETFFYVILANVFSLFVGYAVIDFLV